MAEIWFYAAGEPLQDEEIDERPFEDCVALLELTADRYLGENPTQDPEEGETAITEDRYLVVALDEEEATALGWKPGYYPSPLPAAQGLERLGLDPAEVLED